MENLDGLLNTERMVALVRSFKIKLIYQWK